MKLIILKNPTLIGPMNCLTSKGDFGNYEISKKLLKGFIVDGILQNSNIEWRLNPQTVMKGEI